MRLKAAPVSLPAAGDYVDLVGSYLRHCRARNLSPRSVRTYQAALERFGSYLIETGMPTVAASISREHVESFLAHLRDAGHKPAGVAGRYTALKIFFAWLAEEGEIARSPMERTSRPLVPESPPPVLTEKQLAALLSTCAGRSFEDRRDQAIIRVLIDCGLRVSELVSLTRRSIDLDGGVLTVMGKGRTERRVPFGAKTALALDRYKRSRAGHKDASDGAWWLGQKGPLAANGVREILRRRAAAAGLDRANPHLFRHTFSHLYMAAGGNETHLMRLAGWSDLAMATKYGASAAVERAIAEHRRISPGDRV